MGLIRDAGAGVAAMGMSTHLVTKEMPANKDWAAIKTNARATRARKSIV